MAFVYLAIDSDAPQCLRRWWGPSFFTIRRPFLAQREVEAFYSAFDKSRHCIPHGLFMLRAIFFWTLGCQFIEPINELGIAATLTSGHPACISHKRRAAHRACRPRCLEGPDIGANSQCVLVSVRAKCLRDRRRKGGRVV